MLKKDKWRLGFILLVIVVATVVVFPTFQWRG